MQQILIDFAVNRWPAVLLALVPALLNIGLLFYIQFFMPRRRVNTMLSLFIITLVLWQVLDILMRLSRTEETSRMWDAVLCIGWISAGPIGLHFTLIYTGRKKFISTSAGMALLYLPVVLISSLYTVKVDERRFFFNSSLGWISAHNETVLDKFISYSIAAFAITFCVMLFFHAYKLRFNPEKKRQALLMACGMAIPIIQGLITQIILPAINRKYALPVTSTFMSFFSGATVIALSKGNLYDVNEYIEPGKLINRLREIIFTISPEGMVQYMNNEGQKNLYLSDKSFRDIHYSKLFAPQTNLQDIEENCIRACIRGDLVENFVARLAGRKREMDVLLSASAIISNGILEGIMFVAHNVTELRDSEREREASLAIFSNTVNNMQAGVLIEDENRKVFNVNQELCTIFGFNGSPQEMVGMDCAETIDHFKFIFSHPTYFINRIAELITEKRPCKFEELTLLDGRFLERDYSPIFTSEGVFIGHLWIYRDVTARKIAEEEMKVKNMELEKVNSELDRFVYSASHDIRAPLRSILGLINLAESESNPDDVGQHLALMRKSIAKLDKFTLDLVHYSRNTKLEVFRMPVDFNQLIQKAINLAVESTGYSNVEYSMDIPPHPGFISDPDRLKTVLQNIITNAFAFYDSCKPRPYVRIKASFADNIAQITVEDNGIGISQEHHPRLFDMFFRASQLTIGSGLGLYISKEIMNKLNGQITVDSRVGEGSSFTLHIPDMQLSAQNNGARYIAK
jgi:PAS domain S-box-containing protein